MKKMKVGYFADGPWSHITFEKIIADESIEVKFIVPRSDTSDNTLKNFSEKYAIDYLHPVKINSEEFITLSKDYDCDLFVSMSFNQIFRKEIIRVPKLGVINCHAGKLPEYRGRNILNWVLINDEKEFGITVHYIDEGIDTGDIINQRTFQITDQDDYNSLLHIAYKECANILYQSIKEIQAGTSKRISQKTDLGFYCGRRKEGDEVINWNQSSRRVFNFVRAISFPGPKAKTFLNGSEIKINRANYIESKKKYIGINGQVLAKTDNGYLVKTEDTFVEITEVESKVKIKIGDRFSNEK